MTSELADTYHHLGKVSQKEQALIFYGESVRINKKISEKSALYKVALDMVGQDRFPKALSIKFTHLCNAISACSSWVGSMCDIMFTFSAGHALL